MNDAHVYEMQVQMWKPNTWGVTLQDVEVKIRGFVEPPRLDPELEHEPNSTLTPELIIYYIGEL